MKINKIFLNQNFHSQKEVFEFLGDTMKHLQIVDESDTYIQALLQREEEFSTGLVDGFAIPHGKSVDIHEAAVIYIRNQIPLEWETLDGSFVTDIFALAIPQGQDEHLDILIDLSKKLADTSFCQKLRTYCYESDIQQLLEEGE